MVNSPLLTRCLLDRIANKREFLARSFRTLGILNFLEQVARMRPRSLLILTYHRIATPGVEANPYYDPVVSATPEAFEKQMELLASRYHLVQLNDLDDLQSASVQRSGKPFVLITFDDGYRDNFEVALPILCRHGVPATFFVPTRYVEAPRLPWWDHVAYIIKRTQVPRFAVQRTTDDPDPLTVQLGECPSDVERTRAITSIINQFLAGAINDEARFLAQLDEQAQVALDSSLLGRELFMGWGELNELIGAGMSVGSHGHNHLELGQLDDMMQRQELHDSKRLIEASLAREVTAIAYPYGWPGTFTARTVELAREAGYRWGFSSLEGVNQLTALQSTPLALKRLNIGTGDSRLLLRARLGLYASVGGSFL